MAVIRHKCENIGGDILLSWAWRTSNCLYWTDASCIRQSVYIDFHYSISEIDTILQLHFVYVCQDCMNGLAVSIGSGSVSDALSHNRVLYSTGRLRDCSIQASRSYTPSYSLDPVPNLWLCVCGESVHLSLGDSCMWLWYSCVCVPSTACCGTVCYGEKGVNALMASDRRLPPPLSVCVPLPWGRSSPSVLFTSDVNVSALPAYITILR